ncbi:unnamed protein product, partial [Heterosigma akashiwo]
AALPRAGRGRRPGRGGVSGGWPWTPWRTPGTRFRHDPDLADRYRPMPITPRRKTPSKRQRQKKSEKDTLMTEQQEVSIDGCWIRTEKHGVQILKEIKDVVKTGEFIYQVQLEG